MVVRIALKVLAIPKVKEVDVVRGLPLDARNED